MSTINAITVAKKRTCICCGCNGLLHKFRVWICIQTSPRSNKMSHSKQISGYPENDVLPLWVSCTAFACPLGKYIILGISRNLLAVTHFIWSWTRLDTNSHPENAPQNRWRNGWLLVEKCPFLLLSFCPFLTNCSGPYHASFCMILDSFKY